jgi:hypothetical protein
MTSKYYVVDVRINYAEKSEHGIFYDLIGIVESRTYLIGFDDETPLEINGITEKIRKLDKIVFKGKKLKGATVIYEFNHCDGRIFRFSHDHNPRGLYGMIFLPYSSKTHVVYETTISAPETTKKTKK